MAVEQLKEFLEKGNVVNSVNFPECSLAQVGENRIVMANRNVPNIIGQITHVLAEEKINIAEMINKHKDDFAYNIIDIDSDISEGVVEKIRKIDGILMVRIID